MPPRPPEPTATAPPTPDQREGEIVASLAGFFDAAWYLARYPDVASANTDPLQHFIRHGAAERRDPNRFFDSAWYTEHFPDVAASGMHPLLHYLQAGAKELRNPHPRFDAVYYVDQHPEAAPNPLLYHLRVGLARGYLTEQPIEIGDYLPSAREALPLPRRLVVDVVIPVYRGLEATRRCIESVLTHRGRPLGRVIVIDDRSPEPALAAWLRRLAEQNRIELIRNRRNLGFVASVNRGIKAAGDHDVVLLNSDTEVPADWLHRLAAQAYAQPRIATVSPFSNNATICGYPGNAGGHLAFAHSVGWIDQACREANLGRSVNLPTTVGFCMYIRREALREVGDFDADRFTAGYGEENDFCLRATALGWRHRLACDTFVYHQGSVSFGDRTESLCARASKLIEERYPGYARSVAQYVALGAVVPFRFAVTAALFRQSKLPVILMVAHNLGGGIRRHIRALVERYRDSARILLLAGTDRGSALSVPALPDHPVLMLTAERIDDLILLLRSMNLSRVHIHHLLGVDMDVRKLIHRLALPFDVTVHDYYAICPQTNLLPRPDDFYCGEPDVAGCNACIAALPSHGARDILSWRAERAWQFIEADRALCPSVDVLSRLQRHGLGANAILAPHEPVATGPWPMHPARPGGGKLRIAVLGVLADHKGARTVAAVAEAIDPRTTELHLIGSTENNFIQPALRRLNVTGEYDSADLEQLIETLAPQVIWFPAAWPETFSYTLSAAIASGLPIVATRIGAFIERLAGRPFTWFADVATPTADWIKIFEHIRRALLGNTRHGPVPVRPEVEDFYATKYLSPEPAPHAVSPRRIRRTRSGAVIAVLPERFDIGYPTPCAYIRLLQPLHHLAVAARFDVLVTNADSVLDYAVDIIVTQRYALPDPEAADALLAHARRTGATLLYDLDDDLLSVPRNHPDAAELRPRVKIVRRMLDHADVVWLSTKSLAERLSSVRPDALVVENRLDERIWTHSPPPRPFRDVPVRILCMGTTTHDQDFAMIEPALSRLKEEFGARVAIDILGMTSKDPLPAGLDRISPPIYATRSYPGFVHWLCSAHPAWHIGLAPLLDTPFNRCKSPIKAMDYAAMGMVVLASDMPVFQRTIADGPAGKLVPNQPHAWYAALAWMVRDQKLRRSIAGRAREAFLQQATLASQTEDRRHAWQHVLTARGVEDRLTRTA
jgi:GT2 family glycosyltransferase/glycosyltransferase involved in cell wall biosynthesis